MSAEADETIDEGETHVEVKLSRSSSRTSLSDESSHGQEVKLDEESTTISEIVGDMDMDNEQ